MEIVQIVATLSRRGHPVELTLRSKELTPRQWNICAHESTVCKTLTKQSIRGRAKLGLNSL